MTGVVYAQGREIPGDLQVQPAVSTAGASATQIAIPALPGAGGLDPRLSLTYSSQAGNNGFGLGWSLSGFSTIARGTRTREVDGLPGPINYTDDDAFYLDGERLVPTRELKSHEVPGWLKAANGAIEFRRFTDDGTVAYARRSASGVIQDFFAESKSGLRTEFTKAIDGSPALPSLKAAIAWLPTRTVDTAGNYILWHFNVDGLSYQLSRVEYTGHEGASPVTPFAQLDFNYELTPRPVVTYLLGQAITRSKRLKDVTSTLVGATGPAARGLALTLDYMETEKADGYYLSGAKLSAFGDTVPATKFAYSSSGEPWKEVGKFNMPTLGGAIPIEHAYKLGSASDDAGQPKPALFFSRINNGAVQSMTYVAEVRGWKETAGTRAPPVAFVDEQGHPAPIVAIDLDNDGLSDLVESDRNGKGAAWLQKHDNSSATTDIWVRDRDHDNPGEPFVEADGTPRAVKLLDLGGRKDVVIVRANGDHVVLENTSSGWKSTSLDFKAPPNAYPIFADVDCDGEDERIDLDVTSAGTELRVFEARSSGWARKTDSGWQWRKPSGTTVAIAAVHTGATQCRSLVLETRAASAASIAGLEGSSNGWRPILVSAPGPLLLRADSARLHPAFVDFDGDNDDDVVLSETDASGAVVKESWLQAPRGPGDPLTWAPAAALAPKMLIADQTGSFSDTAVQAWPVGGYNAAIITLPSPRHAKGGVVATAGTDWQDLKDLTPAIPLNRTKEARDPVRFVDLDNDGRQDLIFNDGAGQVGAELNTAGGWQPADRAWHPPHPIIKSGDAAARATLVDVNADGFIDLVYAYQDKDEGTVLETYLNGVPKDTPGWIRDGTWELKAVIADTERGDLGGRFADIDGDGRVDLVQSRVDRNFNVSGTAYINKPTGWDQRASLAPTVAFVYDQGDQRSLDLGTQIFDIDGDRLADLIAGYRDVTRPDDTSRRTQGVFKNNGSGFDRTSTGTVPVMLDSPYFEASTNSFLDVDGDNNLDIVRISKTDGDVYRGIGTGYNPNASGEWKIPASAYDATLGFGATRFVDVNGDNHVDVLYIRPRDRGVIINDGAKWSQTVAPPEWQPPDLPFLTEAGDDAGVRLIDVTGYGALDLVKSARVANEPDDRQAWKNPGKRQGMLDILTASNGIETQFTYARLIDGFQRNLSYFGTNAVFVRDSLAVNAPGIQLTPFSPVVVQTVTTEGADRNLYRLYQYHDFRFDLDNARPLGFARIDRAEHAAGDSFSVIESTYYRQDGDLVGHPSQEDRFIVRGLSPVLVERTTKEWTARPISAAAKPTGGRFGFRQLLLTGTKSETSDLNGNPLGILETSLQYDGWLNTTEVMVTKPGRATQTVTSQFNDALGDSNHERFGRVTKSTAEVRDLASGAVVSRKITSLEYYPTTYLQLSQSVDFGDPELAIATKFERDVRGMVTKTSEAVSANRAARGGGALPPDIRNEHVEYDPIGRLLIRRENAKQQRTTVGYQPGSIGFALAVSTSETDPNGLVSTKEIDALGRPAGLTGPDQVITRIERLRSQDLPAEWVTALSLHRIKSQSWKRPVFVDPAAVWLPPVVGYGEARRVTGANGKTRLERATIYDRHGNVLRVVTRRTDGTKTLLAFQDNQYDVRGRLIGESAPYFAGTTPVWTVYEYDPLDRRVREQRANGAVTITSYRELTQTRTNARGHESRIVYTPDGKPEIVERADKGKVRFTYDAMERVTSVTSPNGVSIRFGYDAAGNRNLTDDPNSGTVEYRFDGFGQLREERVRSKQWAELDYDQLGRPVRDWRPDRETLWSYDKAGAVGKAAEIKLATNGATTLTYSEKFDFDGALRLRRSTTEIHAPGTLDPGVRTDFLGNYTFQYGPFSELAHIIYPTSDPQKTFVVGREYEEDTGQLVKVRDARTSAGPTLWRLSSADAAGRSREVVLGNGAREIRSYHPTTGALDTMSVVSASGAVHLSTGYGYDPLGNLLSRGKPGKPEERFTYDEQNRLVTVKRSGSAKIEVRYDQDDRVIWKTGVGTYRYASDPNAARYCLSPVKLPNALCAVDQNGVVTRSFRFDEYGNMVSRSDPSDPAKKGIGMNVAYTFDNHVARITALGTNGVPDNQEAAEFYYGPTGQRILSREMRNAGDVLGHRRKETLHVGSYERVTVQRGGGASASRLITDRYLIRADRDVFMSLDAIDRNFAKGSERRGLTETRLYLHRDHIGSVVLITDRTGKKAKAVRYDPWGRSNNIDSKNDHDIGLEAAWTRGFTGQNHVSQFELIHMTGRIYDPELGLFLSVDPFMTNPEAGLSDLNPYLYAQGNPLSITDPSGFWGLSDVVRDIGNAINDVGRAIGRGIEDIGRGIDDLWHQAEAWVGQNWRELVTVAVIVAVTVATAGTGTGPVVVAMAAGAAGAATQTALYGGSVQDIIAAGVVGAVIGAFSGAIGASGLDWYYKAVAQGVYSGTQSLVNNGSFERGFLIGALTRVAPGDVVGKSSSNWAVAGRIVTRAVVNGTISQMQGGKFAAAALMALGEGTWDEAGQGQWTIRSKIQSFSWFAPGDPKKLGFGDLITLYSMVSDQRADAGIALLAQFGPPVGLLSEIRERYDQVTGVSYQTGATLSDPAKRVGRYFAHSEPFVLSGAANDNMPNSFPHIWKASSARRVQDRQRVCTLLRAA